ncbi:MAG: HAMP domain-containing histidine kinase [Gammaproteobacteria bacterium]|nr:HAMP domain-containing histidine kinase [Gammaproteobacteria bacterium]
MIRRFIHGIGHSLSARLIAIFLITSLVYGIASRYAVDLVLDRHYLGEVISAHVALHANYLVQDLGSPPDVEKARGIAEQHPMDIRILGPGLDWVSDPAFPTLDVLQDNMEPGQPHMFFEQVEQAGPDAPVWMETLENMYFTRYQEHSFIMIEKGAYRIVIASPKIALQPPMPDLTTPIIGLISILVLAGCFFTVSWLIRPIRWIKEGARRIGQGELDYRIPKKRRDDLGDLTVDINRMADDVQGMLEAKQQMLLAISHELRSPLTRTKVALEFLEDQKTRQSILDDVEEMEHLINDLLESERLNTRHSKLQLKSVDLIKLIDDLVSADFSDDRHKIRLALPSDPVFCDVDETRIRLLVKNLIDNALCYAPADGNEIGITAEEHAGQISIQVRDNGCGMSPEQVERATEPFYRADPARCRDTGGFGLGLYLCRRIAEAHGGTLEIRSEEGRGTQVKLKLPVPAEIAASA